MGLYAYGKHKTTNYDNFLTLQIIVELSFLDVSCLCQFTEVYIGIRVNFITDGNYNNNIEIDYFKEVIENIY